jgi:diaminohydroxyphosphoribosylaminopyrimidine deaminase / 5-amino-6-(5-phosphoribosylamino)uracil reductase
VATLDDDARFLSTAADLALRGRGRVEPNPMVGALVVKDGRVVGRGWHSQYGRAHAERAALDHAGRRARGATLYVTLEPCSTFGKTPPCVERVVVAGVRRVVAGAIDPNPANRGRGLAILRAAGIDAVVARHRESAALASAFRRDLTRRRPFVTAKWAMTADGFIATRDRDSKWITSPAARRRAHHERATSDGVLIGAGTALADDPRLTARGLSGLEPVRIVLDGRARLGPASRLVRTARRTPTWLVACRGASSARLERLRAAGVRVFVLPGRGGRAPLASVLALLRSEGIGRLLVEGGAEVLGPLLREGLADRVLAFVAPKLLLGGDGRTPLAGRGAARMAGALELREARVVRIGTDALLEGLVGSGGSR